MQDDDQARDTPVESSCSKAQDNENLLTEKQPGSLFLLSYQNKIQVASSLKISRQHLVSSRKPRNFLRALLISLSIFPMAGTGIPTPTVWCVECEDVAASVFCESCKDNFCGLCFQWQHRSGNRSSHVAKPLPGQNYTSNRRSPSS